MKKTNLATGRGGRVVATCFRCLFVIPMLLLGCFGATSAAAQTQQALSRVSLDAPDATVITVFQAIQQQTGCSFVYNTSDIDTDRKVSLSVHDEPLQAVLDKLFAGSDIAYTLRDKHIVLSKKAKNSPPHSAQGGVTGVIKDDKGMPLVGATVLIKGTTTGAAADIDGNFSLPQAKPGDTLEISLIGYTKQELPVSGSAPLSVVMHEDNEVLDAVVVTALGIKRSEKALTYNVQEVAGDIVNTVKDANFMNSLSGKVAGLQINASASGVGGSTRVVMRGVKSISGNNNALYVIDGIPMPDLRSSQTEGTYETPDGGDFEGISNLNPEDIESMTVLSGATAAALYGSQGANGVIVITTKKGEEGRVRVNYANNTTFSSPFVMPQFQNTYGTEATAPSMSWGTKLSTPTSYDPSDFFQTGFEETNAISVSGGTRVNQSYFSAASLNSRGIIPNNVYNRYNFTFRNTTQLIKDKLTLDLGASYMRQYKRNPLVQGLYHNPLIPISLFPRGDDISKYEVYERYDATAGYMKQFWPLEFITGVENPWWITNRELFENTAHRYTFNATLKWDIADWITLTGRVRTDNMVMNYTRKIYASSDKLFASEYGNYQNNKIHHNNLYADALLSINKSFFDDKFSLSFNLGASILDDKNDGEGFEGHLATIANKFSVYNVDMSHSQTKPYADRYHDQTQAVYATAQLGYNGMVYLDVTARNEWASQLAFTPHMNIFYPSVGLSAVISSMADLSKAGISFLKVRASYAEVGNAPQRFITGVNTPLQTGGIVSSDSYAPAVNLTPERTKSFEVGLTMRFLKHFNLDLTYYNSRTQNQTFDPQIPGGSGYSSIIIQSGNVRNRGIELALGYKNTWRDFTWDTNYTFSTNKNKITSLANNCINPATGEQFSIDLLDMGGLGDARFLLMEGGTLGDLYSLVDLKYDNNNAIYVDEEGNIPTQSIEDVKKFIKLGSVLPDANMSWRNDFRWKNLNFGFMVSARLGGVVFSRTQATLDYFGVSEATAAARDRGGVMINGRDMVDANLWYSAIAGGNSLPQFYTYSATNVRLQEASIGYTIPRKWLRNVCEITVSVVGRNLWMIYNKAPFDPESIATTGNYYQGVDYFMMPSLRNVGFNLRLKF